MFAFFYRWSSFLLRLLRNFQPFVGVRPSVDRPRPHDGRRRAAMGDHLSEYWWVAVGRTPSMQCSDKREDEVHPPSHPPSLPPSFLPLSFTHPSMCNLDPIVPRGGKPETHPRDRPPHPGWRRWLIGDVHVHLCRGCSAECLPSSAPAPAPHPHHPNNGIQK